ncbi:potassium channel family protein [Bacillus sp. FJAT-27986]|uniref:potassium channel family protein n=1 Tax=Bacillus sp. FJAT-27986 TaxID=1743146 RepID=UPI000981F52B|nr:potassium channel family protein [Bacillus sp. FJAT-27986]
MFYIILAAVVITLLMSLKGLLMPTDPTRAERISLDYLYWIITVYFTFLIGFGILYVLVEMKFGTVIHLNGLPIEGGLFQKLASSFYFSTMTLLSVGYGDMVPVGFGRWIASMEALIGYALPAAFVVRTAIDLEHAKTTRN